jgi:hypothetical protein
MTYNNHPQEIQQLLDQVYRLAELGDGMPGEDSPLGMLTWQFFDNNWKQCKEGLVRKTSKIHIWPALAQSPRIFKFEIECAYKRKRNRDAPVELMPGPVRGTVFYRPDVFTNTDDPAVAVALDQDQAFYHPNHSSINGFICLGELPTNPYPFPLDQLMEDVIYPLVTYQSRRPVHPLDLDAAHYFALDPDAMQGLEPPQPLY